MLLGVIRPRLSRPGHVRRGDRQRKGAGAGRVPRKNAASLGQAGVFGADRAGHWPGITRSQAQTTTADRAGSFRRAPCRLPMR